MKGYTHLLMRELSQRKNLWWAALAAGFIPMLLQVLPGIHYAPAEIRDASALAISATFGLFIALLLGASVLARDLSEGRLGFDFTRPMGNVSIWAGRMSAAVLLALGGAIVAVLPATISGGGVLRIFDASSSSGWTPQEGGIAPPGPLTMVLLFILVVLLCTSAAHAVSVMARSRSPWLLADMGLFLICLAALFLTGRYLHKQGVWPAAANGAWAALAVFVAALLAAGILQVSKGRTDIKVGHRVLSVTLWSVCLLGALLLVGYGKWYVRVSPADLAAVYGGQASPGGRWIYLRGPMKHRSDEFRPSFLYNPKTGWSLRLGVGAWAMAFSPDGSRCVWLHGGKRPELYSANLAKPHPVAASAHIISPQSYVRLALSARGDRCAVATRSNISVYDLSSGKLLASAHLGNPGQPAPGASGLVRMRFESDNTLRIYSVSTDPENTNASDLTIQSLDVARRSLTTTGRLAHLSGSIHILPGAAGSRFILAAYRTGKWTLSLHDGTDGSILAPLAQGGHAISAAFLSGGRIAAAGRVNGRPHLWTFTRNGVLEESIELPVEGTAVLGAEPSPGRLLAAVFSGRRGSDRSWTLFEIDESTGAVRPVAKHLHPLELHWWFSRAQLPVGKAARFAVASNGSLVKLNLANGKKTVLIHGSHK
ncbi:MAG: hypothetical protein P8Z49_07535 [Acidobacteriota bacterium]|jgi:hypothetical protein